MHPRLRPPVALSMTLLVLFSVVAPFAVAAAEPLPVDPAIVSGELDNGVRYMVRKHSIPEGRAVVWIHIHSGSLNETDRQRGMAHYLEHMAFNGSENFKPGELIPFFQSMGMTFGRDQNAFTSFDQTTYQLSLPNAKPETIGKGLTFFADVVNSLSLLPGEIESERQIILEERRRSLGARQRMNDIVMERLTPGSLFGVRMPIGTEETIKSVMQQDFQDYYGKWYTPSNTTILVVADADPAEVIGVIREKFGKLPKKPRPAPQELGVKAYDRSFAIVASDPELTSADVRIVRTEPARPPVTTVAQYRDDLVLRLGTSAMNRRLGEKSDSGKVPFLSARVSASDSANAVREVETVARASTGKWKDALQAVALELQRGRAFGFSDRELDRVRKDIVSSAERAVEVEATVPAQALISRMNSAVASGEPAMSPAQRLALLNKLLPTITTDEVHKRFSAEFEPKAVAFVAVLPSGDSVPSESELLAIGTAALAVEPTKEPEVVHATTLMGELPGPAGTVVVSDEHAATKVWSGWLSNNVRVHYRFMDQEKDEVSIRISLLGGELLETAENRGVTAAAQLAWSRPATRKLSSSDIRDIMTGKKVSVRGGGFGGGMGGRGGGRRGGGGGGGGSGDSINLTISGKTEELETGFQLAHVLLTEPLIESAGLEQYKTNAKQMLREAESNPMMAGMRAAGAAPYPEDEPRTRPLSAEQIDRIELDAAQAWLEKLIRQSPIEVVIVGDVSRDRAMELVGRYVGSLSSRDRVSPNLYADLRKLPRPSGAWPRVIEKTVATPTKQAFVMSGFYSADETNRPDTRALGVASRVLSTRMTKEVREEAQLVYSIGASNRAGSTFPGFGMFSAAAPTEPQKAGALVDKLTSMYERFAKEGPSEEELAVARKQFATTYDEQLKQPSFWAQRLNQLTFRGLSLDDLASEPQAYQEVTSAQIREAFAKYYSKDNAVMVVVKPKDSAPTTRTAEADRDGDIKRGG